MTTSKDLLLAILAMDSYNRGYDEGISGLGGLNSTIGSATLKQQSDTAQGTPGVASGFYAAAYTIGTGVDGIASGTTIISYRGTSTNSTGATLLDAATGWPIGAGVYGATQAQQAIDFYNAASGHLVSDGTKDYGDTPLN
jgi:hypothetical protein